MYYYFVKFIILNAHLGFSKVTVTQCVLTPGLQRVLRKLGAVGQTVSQ